MPPTFTGGPPFAVRWEDCGAESGHSFFNDPAEAAAGRRRHGCSQHSGHSHDASHTGGTHRTARVVRLGCSVRQRCVAPEVPIARKLRDDPVGRIPIFVRGMSICRRTTVAPPRSDANHADQQATATGLRIQQSAFAIDQDHENGHTAFAAMTGAFEMHTSMKLRTLLIAATFATCINASGDEFTQRLIEKSLPSPAEIQSPVPPSSFLRQREAEEVKAAENAFWDITTLPVVLLENETSRHVNASGQKTAVPSHGIGQPSVVRNSLFTTTTDDNWLRNCLPCSYSQELVAAPDRVVSGAAVKAVPEAASYPPAKFVSAAAWGDEYQYVVKHGCCDGDGCGESCGSQNYCLSKCYRSLCDESSTTLTVYGGIVALSRTNPNGQTLIVNPANRAQGINAGNFDFSPQAGYEIGAIAHQAFGNADLDIRFFDLNQWSATQNAVLTGNTVRIATPNPIDISGPRRVTSRYSSGLKNFEANLRWRKQSGCGCDCDWLTVIAGFRYLNLRESLSGSLSPAGGQGAERVFVDVNNQLYGAQVGLDATIFGSDTFCLESYGRAGLYGNDSSARVGRASAGNPAVRLPTSGNNGGSSFVGEIGVKARLRVTDRVSAYGRYQVIAIDGVSLASEQFGTTNLITSNGSPNDAAYFQGGTIGLEFAY